MTKDDVLIEKGKRKCGQYIKKFSPKCMENYMRHVLLHDDIDQRWLDSFHKIHGLLVRWNDERVFDCLLKNGTGDKFCDPSGVMQCGAFYSNGTKGQLISKCSFGVFKSPKKPTKYL